MNKYLKLFIPLLVIGIGFQVLKKEPVVTEKWKHTVYSAEELADLHKKQKKARRDTGYFKQDKPDKFLEYIYMLKTGGNPENEYPHNYSITELSKAKQRAVRLKSTKAGLNWVERGPGNVAGRARGLVIDPDDTSGNTWFVGSVGGGIWKTSDAGNNWKTLTDDWPNLAVSCLQMAPSNHDVLYAGTGEGFGNLDAITGNGIFKSSNGGENWEQLSSTINNNHFKFVNRIVVHPDDESIVWAATNTTIQKSDDGGVTWNKIYENVNDGYYTKIQDLRMDPSDASVLLATVNNKGIVKTTDGGANWTLVKSIKSGRIELGVSKNFPDQMYAMSSDSQLYVSLDGGETWIKVSGITDNQFLSGQGWYNNTLVAHPTNKNVLFVGGLDVHKLTLNVQTTTEETTISVTPKRLTVWSAHVGNSNYAHADHHNLQIVETAGDPFRILDCNDGGINFSDDGGSVWKTQVNGFVSTQFYGIAKHPEKNIYLGGTQDNGSWQSEEGALSTDPWKSVGGGDGFEAIWNAQDASKRMISLYNNYLIATYDNGETWVSLEGLPGFYDDKISPFVTRIANTGSYPDLVMVGNKNGIQRSEDFGKTWKEVEVPSQSWMSGSYNPIIEISPVNTRYVWAGTFIGDSRPPSLSKDGGKTFEVVNTPFTSHSTYLSEIVAHPSNEKAAFLVFAQNGSPKVYKTEDLGQTWTELSGFGRSNKSSNGFPDVAIYDLVVMPGNDDVIWVGTEIGLFESTDGGQNWYYANNGLPAVCIWDMHISGQQLVLGTHGRGVWSVDLPTLLNKDINTPFVQAVGKRPDGQFGFQLKYPQEYDKVELLVDDNVIKEYTSVSAGDENFILSLDNTEASFVVQLKAYAGDYYAYSNYYEVKNPELFRPTQKYVNSFETEQNDFDGEGFSINNSLFTNDAIHSEHPYKQNGDFIYKLKYPIEILESNKATLSYKDIAFVEQGENNVPFGQSGFYDFVVVEGSKDGINWLPLKEGYDVRYSSKWKNFVGNDYSKIENVPNDKSLFEYHTINLTETFQAGDVILVRFRLHSDPYTVGWGWIIDDLKIQEEGTYTGIEKASVKATGTAPNGQLAFQLTFPESVSKADLFVNEQLVETFTQLEAGEFIHNEDLWGISGVYSVKLVVYNGEAEAYSVKAQGEKIGLNEAVERYMNSFSNRKYDFHGEGFNITSGLNSNWAIHTNHPYGVGQDFTYTLKYPVKVLEDEEKSLIQYNDIALVEAGSEGSVYGSVDFADYVIVEATKDGVNWKPLSDGYDISYSSQWTNFKGKSVEQVVSLFTTQDAKVSHTYNLQPLFEPNDLVLVRFRLHSDAQNTEYGWIIDDLIIQESGTATDDMEQTNDVLSIINKGARSVEVKLSGESFGGLNLNIYDMSGRCVYRNKYNKTSQLWNQTINLNQLAAGVKIITVSVDGKLYKQKFMLR